MITDQRTGIPVATAQFDDLDGREMFLMALAARDLIVTSMTDMPGNPYQPYSVSYLTEPLPAAEPGAVVQVTVPASVLAELGEDDRRFTVGDDLYVMTAES